MRTTHSRARCSTTEVRDVLAGATAEQGVTNEHCVGVTSSRCSSQAAAPVPLVKSALSRVAQAWRRGTLLRSRRAPYRYDSRSLRWFILSRGKCAGKRILRSWKDLTRTQMSPGTLGLDRCCPTQTDSKVDGCPNTVASLQPHRKDMHATQTRPRQHGAAERGSTGLVERWATRTSTTRIRARH